MHIIRNKLALITLICIYLTSCTLDQKGPIIEEGSATIGSKDNVVNLDQNWSADTQQAFYFTAQGSRILPYAWYLALELANGQTLFRDDANMAALRYLPSKKSTWNPDGLAVGFVKDIDSRSKEEWIGLNCAACHTAQINYNGVSMRIDGGPTLGDFEKFNTKLVDALRATYESNEKFSRFVNVILGKNHSADEAINLRAKLLQQTMVLENRNKINHSDENQPHYGYGRVDAIGAIFNQVLAKFNGMPNNGHISNAPASYPFLWGTHQSDVVQWTGFAPNGPDSIGALIRNGGEVLGVYGQLSLPDDKSIKHYKSSIDIKNLGKLESWVAELRSPIWPAEYLPAINVELAANGQRHYDKYCAACHEVIARKDQGKKYKAVLTPLTEVGTDPQEIINLSKVRPSGNFFERKEAVIVGDKISAQTTGLDPLVNAVVGSLLQHPIKALEAAIIEFEGGIIAATPDDGINEETSDIIPSRLKAYVAQYSKLRHQHTKENDTASSQDNAAVYKARPLTGIWATAPYLHNGSVPNLYELLLSADQRSKKFYLGSREFDPVKVGFVSTPNIPDAIAFEFDTRLVGNSNSGHEYGVNDLSGQEKKELLEYLKTL